MKRLVFVAMASLVVACGNRGTDSRASGRADQSEPRAQAGARSNEPAPEASSPSATAGTTARQDQRVTLTGCLRGGESAAGPAGTSGRTPPPPTGATSGVSGAAGQFSLTKARPADAAPEGGRAAGSGVGANGAGGSGGPLVSGVSSYLLSGSTPELQAHVNQQVRITGAIDPRETIADAPPPAHGGGPATQAQRHLVVESIQSVSPSCP
jgi:hypothetical protein